MISAAAFFVTKVTAKLQHFAVVRFVGLLYQKHSKSQVFISFFRVSTTFCIIFVRILCKHRHKILVAISGNLQYLVAKSYKCLHKSSNPVPPCYGPVFGVMSTEGIINDKLQIINFDLGYRV